MEELGVSVICNTYNHENHIRKALDGFVMQKTDFAFEVLIHDDASTDGTANIIREYEKKYPELIKPIYQKQNQYSQHVRVGLKFQHPRARGKYIALCEGDDYWTDEYKLQKQYDYMQQHEKCSLVGHKTWKHYVDTDKFAPYTGFDFDKENKYDFNVEDMINDHMLLHTSSIFMRKKAHDEHNDFLQHNPNFDYVIKILLASSGYVHIIPEYMSVYNVGVEGSWSKRVHDVTEKHKQHIERAISTMERLNEYTNYKYNACFRQNIKEREFVILCRDHNFTQMKKEPYIGLYRDLSFTRKAMLYMEKYTPELSKLLLKLKHSLKF